MSPFSGEENLNVDSERKLWNSIFQRPVECGPLQPRKITVDIHKGASHRPSRDEEQCQVLQGSGSHEPLAFLGFGTTQSGRVYPDDMKARKTGSGYMLSGRDSTGHTGRNYSCQTI